MRRVPTKSNNSHSPNLLGAHRYTISDGTCALPRVSCGVHCPCCPCAIGAVPLPLQREGQRLPHHPSSGRHRNRTRGYEVLRIVRLPEQNKSRERMQSAMKAMRAAERRLSDGKVSEHTHFRRQQGWK